jgi:hypothetical protein
MLSVQGSLKSARSSASAHLVTMGKTDCDATNTRTFRPIASCRKNAGLEKSSQGSRSISIRVKR